MLKLIPMVIETVVSASTSVAVGSLTKLVTPPGIRAFTGYLIKGASFVGAGIISAKIAEYAVKNTEAVLDIVNAPDEIAASTEGDK